MLAAAKYIGAGMATIGLALGFALSEATGLFALMIAFLLLYS